MNISLLTKLVKLANNNPNDNEANSAARRVCKMIEDDKFKFVEDKQLNNNDWPNPTKYTYRSTGDVYQDILNIMKDLHKI